MEYDGAVTLGHDLAQGEPRPAPRINLSLTKLLQPVENRDGTGESSRQSQGKAGGVNARRLFLRRSQRCAGGLSCVARFGASAVLVSAGLTRAFVESGRQSADQSPGNSSSKGSWPPGDSRRATSFTISMSAPAKSQSY